MNNSRRRCFITAELGTAHGGSQEKAHRLIEAAAASGVDAVKFQWVIAREILHPLAGIIELPGGPTPLFSQFQALERPFEFYAFLKEKSEQSGLEFLCSPFGLESLEGIRRLGCKRVKFASPELNHLPLIEEAWTFQQIILSTGLSTLGDIEEAVSLCGRKSLVLHCVTRYPAPEAEYNLNVLPHISALLGVEVGVSDHSRHPELIPALTAALGGRMVEKHFTIKRTDQGLDDPIALEPEEMNRLVRAVRRAEDEGLEGTIERLSSEYGAAGVKAILGDGRKVLAPSELPYYASTNRSIMAVEDILPGEILTRENTALLRSETNLSPGLPPRFWQEVLGRRARKKISSGEGIRWYFL